MPLDHDGPDQQPPPAGSGELTPAPRASDADRDAALVAPRLTAVAVLGGCVLDLRAASFTAPVTTITAVTVLSGVDVLVPPGVRVELSVYGLFGDAGGLVPEQDLPSEAPLVRVRCFALVGGVEAKPRLRRDMRAVDP